MAEKYVAPALNEKAFHCALCGVYSNQIWQDMAFVVQGWPRVEHWRSSYCSHCHERAFWRGAAMIFPTGGTAPLPSADLPPGIKADYEEARSIVSRSPRGAAALLRLCIQKLCKHLGEAGKKIDDDIASLVKKGLPVAVQQALDTVRVTGNEAVHPGTIDLRDNQKLAAALFGLVNFIVEKMISEPKQIEELYNSLPKEKLEGIQARDKKKS
jgi:hypothetical protein